MITNLAGTQIRAIRATRNLTQQQLADLAKIPRATLASVERDDGNPSLAVVFKIALALGTTVDELIIEEHQRVQTINKCDMPTTQSEDGTYHAIIVSPPDSKHLLQLIFTLDPESAYEGKPHPPGSEEYLHILNGEVIIEVAGENMHLKKGDSARFGGNVHHIYRNPTKSAVMGLVTILEK